MDALQIRERPTLQTPIFIAAFTGWPDAAEVSSGAVRFLIERLDARKFGEIDPERFFDFSEQRPTIGGSRVNRRLIRWPASEFYGWQSPDRARYLILFVAPEPHLRWRTYCSLLLDLAQSYESRLFVTLGGTFDAVPHTGRPKITGWSNSAEWTDKLREAGVSSVEYEGPTAIHSAVLDACEERSMPTITLWGHSPQYVRTAPNPKVCHAALDRLRQLLGLNVNLDRLRGAALALDERVSQAVRADPELAEYVRRLEESYEVIADESDQRPPGSGAAELPDSQTIVREWEEFLRGQSGDEPDEAGRQ